MTCDNFNIIYNFLEFKNEFDFYFITLIKRSKDQSENSKFVYRLNDPARNLTGIDTPVKTFYIFNKNDLLKYKEEIITLSNLYNARAYIYLQRKNYKEVFKYAAKSFMDIFISDNYSINYDIATYACINCILDNTNKYLIDLDKEEFDKEQDILEIVKKYNQNNFIILPSLTGKHIICTNFNRYEFMLKFPMINVLENRPTLLYFKKEEQ